MKGKEKQSGVGKAAHLSQLAENNAERIFGIGCNRVDVCDEELVRVVNLARGDEDGGP